jgi:hypothetical protein
MSGREEGKAYYDHRHNLRSAWYITKKTSKNNKNNIYKKLLLRERDDASYFSLSIRHDVHFIIIFFHHHCFYLTNALFNTHIYMFLVPSLNGFRDFHFIT